MKRRPLLPFALIALLGVILIVVLSTVGQQQRANMDKEGDDTGEPMVIEDPIAHGEQVVQKSCVSCHATDLAGTGNAPALNALEGKLSKEEIIEVVKNGRGGMPSFSGTFKDEEIDAIAEYLLSLSK
ncbi:c-type cytochrome [Shouchella lonarensis]|uniref:Cytochrome c550 n=1 Tax=Shouchella lonarensis TaxID=1464122 RepID=A0A1G6KL51_9BACI|nr:cytochrome c [Shouchella lonarensis]SDC31799.1 cytochrome c550 [Shouchella lonarensis]